MTAIDELPQPEAAQTCVCCPICRPVACDGVAKGGVCEDECDCSDWSKGVEA